MIISDKTRIQHRLHMWLVIQEQNHEKIWLKYDKISAHDILVPPQCKILAVVLQECFKIKFGAFLVINSISNKVYVVNLALRVYLWNL